MLHLKYTRFIDGMLQLHDYSTLTHARTHTHAHMHARTHARTCAHTCTHTHTHTHTLTLTHTVKKAASSGPVVDIWKKEREMSRRKILSIILVFYLWCVLLW